jgi:hypothetical protein
MIKGILRIAFAIAAHAAMAADSSVPPFAKGDLVAFAGDSITSGGTYHKYILTYWTTRHPQLGVRIRNKGIGKKSREEIASMISGLLEESTHSNNKAMIRRCTTYLADFPQESALDQTILDLEAKIAASPQPQRMKVSIESTAPPSPAAPPSAAKP